MGNPVFTQRDDGSVTVDAFMPEIMVSREFLEDAHPRFVSRLGFRTFAIAVANGGAKYRLVRRNDWHTFVCTRQA